MSSSRPSSQLTPTAGAPVSSAGVRLWASRGRPGSSTMRHSRTSIWRRALRTRTRIQVSQYCAPSATPLRAVLPVRMLIGRNRPRFDPRARAHRARSITLHTIQRAHQARRELLLVVPLTALTILAFIFREELFGVDTPVRVAAAIVLVVLGWALARDVGRWAQPALFRRVDPGTAGTVSFLIRLTFLALAALVALRIAGLNPRTLAVGGAITAVVFGLAAQQTLGNLIAGLVLISARPFRIGDRVRLQGGGLAGQLEGTVASLGLLYVTFAQGEDSIMVPNNVVLTSAVVPLREPAAVDLRARLRPDVKPSEVQQLLQDAVRTPVRGAA